MVDVFVLPNPNINIVKGLKNTKNKQTMELNALAISSKGS